ncbi:response regulator [Leptolyngbya sp. 7M]|nr:response regulator [Leptolyngbya sp. 7M]
MGETCISLNPQRILTLDSFVLGDVLALLDTKPIATVINREQNLLYLKEAAEGIQVIPRVNSQLNLEKVLLLNPDLIVGLSIYPQSVYQQLSKIAPTIFVPWREISYDWKQRFKDVAVMLDKTEVANRYMADYQRRVEALLALTLEKSGYRVLQARDGQEALSHLQQRSSVQLVICDIEMPNMNGFEFLSQRRQDPNLTAIPVVILTSRNNEKHRHLAMHLGATAYFSKPYIEHELLDALKHLLVQI